MTTDPHNPADESPLTFEADTGTNGVAATFTVLPGARLRCGSCGAEGSASEQRADDVARTEGASDPADMTMTLPIVCPVCQAEGSLTLGYGPGADPDSSDFIAAVPRDPRAG